MQELPNVNLEMQKLRNAQETQALKVAKLRTTETKIRTRNATTEQYKTQKCKSQEAHQKCKREEMQSAEVQKLRNTSEMQMLRFATLRNAKAKCIFFS